MSISKDTKVTRAIRTIGICVGITAFLFGAFESYITTKYETKQNYSLAISATQEIILLRKDIYIRIDRIENSLHKIDIEVKILQERITKLR